MLVLLCHLSCNKRHLSHYIATHDTTAADTDGTAVGASEISLVDYHAKITMIIIAFVGPGCLLD